MTAERKTSLRSTLLAIVAALAIVGPDLVAINTTDWKTIARGLVGLFVALGINGKGVAVVNMFLPAQKAGDEPTTTTKGTES